MPTEDTTTHSSAGMRSLSLSGWSSTRMYLKSLFLGPFVAPNVSANATGWWECLQARVYFGGWSQWKAIVSGKSKTGKGGQLNSCVAYWADQCWEESLLGLSDSVLHNCKIIYRNNLKQRTIFCCCFRLLGCLQNLRFSVSLAIHMTRAYLNTLRAGLFLVASYF